MPNGKHLTQGFSAGTSHLIGHVADDLYYGFMTAARSASSGATDLPRRTIHDDDVGVNEFLDVILVTVELPGLPPPH
jgi:hypothetical protein